MHLLLSRLLEEEEEKVLSLERKNASVKDDEVVNQERKTMRQA